jgi:hypothetical protein
LAAAETLRARSFLIDGEAVACDGDGLPVFDRLRYPRQDGRLFLFAFTLSVGSVARLAEDEKPERTRSEARGRRGLGPKAMAMKAGLAPSELPP